MPRFEENKSAKPKYSLFAWGANIHGQLGLDIKCNGKVEPQEVDLSKCGLLPKDIAKIVGGSGHTLILDIHGNVYSCGLNDCGQAGFESTSDCSDDVLNFHRVNIYNKKAIDVACGGNTSAALMDNADLYMWGSNFYGQLGEGPLLQSWTAKPIPFLFEKVRHVSLGLNHSAVVTKDNNLLVAGSNIWGQLGLLNKNHEHNEVSKFTTVPGVINVDDVACGEYHTIVTTSPQNNRYTTYLFGDNRFGQLKIEPKKIKQICSPRRSIHYDARIQSLIQISSGHHHTNVLSDGSLYSWGRNHCGQLGRGISDQYCYEIKCIDSLPRTVQVATGMHHNIALNENGKIFCWGWNQYGNCGNNEVIDVAVPTCPKLPVHTKGVLVGAGAMSSFALIKYQT